MATALFSLEGVLRTETGDPIHTGLKLFRSMCDAYRIVIGTDGPAEEAEHWLRANMVLGYAGVYDNRMAFEGQDLRMRHLATLRSQSVVELFVDADVDRATAALAAGVPTILVLSPTFIRKKREVKPWEHIKNEINAQKELSIELMTNPLKRWE